MQEFVRRYAGRAMAAACVSVGVWLTSIGVVVPEGWMEALSVLGIGIAIMAYDIIERKVRGLFKKDDEPNG